MRYKALIILQITLFSVNSSAISFKEIAQALSAHESVESITSMAKSMKQEARIQGSWNDPEFKVAAKNYPKDSLKDDKTPMTGIEFGISQKIALTTKYGHKKRSQTSMSNAKNFMAQDKREELIKDLWKVVILRKRIQEETVILKENRSWINKILKVSKNHYVNGKISQQAILDIQIRKSEIQSALSNKGYELSQLEDKLSYLMGSKHIKLDYSSVPWKILSSKNTEVKDFNELALKERLAAKEFNLSASKLNYVPDITLGIAYTKRSNIDNNGDFLSASVSFPIPLSDHKYAGHEKATQEKYAAIKEYESYKKTKSRNSSILNKQIKKLEAEIRILTKSTIQFARNSRAITSKSYGLGRSSYVELLQSELKLQEILLKKVMLISERNMKKVALKYLLGESLYE